MNSAIMYFFFFFLVSLGLFFFLQCHTMRTSVCGQISKWKTKQLYSRSAGYGWSAIHQEKQLSSQQGQVQNGEYFIKWVVSTSHTHHWGNPNLLQKTGWQSLEHCGVATTAKSILRNIGQFLRSARRRHSGLATDLVASFSCRVPNKVATGHSSRSPAPRPSCCPVIGSLAIYVT